MLVEAICKEKGITQTKVMKSGEPKMKNLNLFEKINTLKEKNISDNKYCCLFWKNNSIYICKGRRKLLPSQKLRFWSLS